MEKKEYSLREKKFARTKVALMSEIIRRMENTRFDAISIKEVCDSVEVSEGTFFNYFPQKIDVLYYFIQLHAIKLLYDTLSRTKPGSYIAFIENLFANLFADMNNPYIVYEIISALIGQKQEPKEVEISVLEKIYSYPESEGIDRVPVPSTMLENIFKEYLEKAVANKELPEKTDIAEVVLTLKSLMVGIPLGLKIKNFQYCGEHYSRQLKILWTGIKELYKQEGL